MLALIQWLFSHTVESGGRGIGTDGRQILGLLTPCLGFPSVRVHRHSAEDEPVKYPQTRSLGPVMGVREAEGGGEAVGIGKPEQSQVSFCGLSGICAASRILQTNSLALYIGSHTCTMPTEPPASPGQSRPLHYATTPSSASATPTPPTPCHWMVWPVTSLFLSPLLFFHDPIKNYDSLQEVKAFFRDGHAKNSLAHGLPHTVLGPS